MKGLLKAGILPFFILFFVISGCANSPSAGSSSSSTSAGPSVVSTWNGSIYDSSGNGTCTFTIYSDNSFVFKFTVAPSYGSGTGTISFTGTSFTVPSLAGTIYNPTLSPTNSSFTGSVSGSTNNNTMSGSYSMTFPNWYSGSGGSFFATEQ